MSGITATKRKAAGLAHPLDAKLVVGRRRDVVEDFDPRHVERARQQIVGQRAVEELALLVKRQPLVKGVADPLGDAALDLASDDQLVDAAPDVVHD